ncbi:MULTISPECIES: transglycosylase domain-containing protein [unclassified Rathayibacter]|uniref:penicillin-binding protein n=1 Tax=unclassified Rathayibacter TaxID=2609250 RepID=UPI000CE882F6|nr:MULTISPECIES: transglycosylase domain-containing protein [unclassified Rathayibacter]PPH17235.1 penicillin-binding protein [Rathayibacter sp. AY1F8]PPH77105.1 penicillin-binding protein [Rathayibacter sp. AY1D4]PPH90752.1 penicillin-binding protein [Rathayibacter sp. AY1D3]
MSGQGGTRVVKTIGGAVGGLIGIVAMSVVAGVLVAASVTPAIALSGMAAGNTVEMFDNLPEYLEIGTLAEKSDVYAKDSSGGDVLLASFYAQNRVEVGWDEISPFVKDAVVASEDPRFYEHGGIDLLGTVRAAATTAMGGDVQGGSSITQQYVKNVLVQKAEALSDPIERDAAYREATETAPERKVAEMRLAIGLEKEYPKNDILLGYLNIALFGGTVYGVEAAARYYFGVSAKDLSLAQSAALVAIVNNPEKFRFDRPGDPANPAAEGYPQTRDRRDYIVTRMDLESKVTSEQAQAAVAEPVTPDITEPSTGCQTAGVAAFFCDYVTWVIKNDDAFGASQDERDATFKRGGYRIYTTLDSDLQQAAVSATDDWVPKSMANVNIGSASVSVEVGTGRILAMTQNKDYSNDPDLTGPNYTSVNYNTDFGYGGSSGFQVGSTYKVFTLAEWLQEGHSLGESVDGTRRAYTTFRDSCEPDGVYYGESWNPGNDEGGNGGVTTALQATTGSINTSFAAMAQQLDLCGIRNTALAMGVHRADGTELQKLAPTILGTNEIAPLTMATAFAGFANKGTVCTPIAIDRIVDRTGADVAPPASECSQGMSEEVAATAGYALQQVVTGGTGAPSNPRTGVPHIGKTGTTDDALHTWMVGASTEVATATWVGNVTGFTSMRGFSLNRVNAGQVRHQIWPRIMRVADAKYGGTAFPAPVRSLLDAPQEAVPQVTGQSPSAAAARLRSVGFTVRVDTSPVPSDRPAGTVAQTNPPAGSRVSRGAEITLQISAGPGAPPRAG